MHSSGEDPSSSACVVDLERGPSSLNAPQHSWNFFAIDIKNEPHGDASWGDSNPKTDFNHYAERTIVRLHQEHPGWTGLFVVEGVGDHADADYHAPYKIWWGSDGESVSVHGAWGGE